MLWGFEPGEKRSTRARDRARAVVQILAPHVEGIPLDRLRRPARPAGVVREIAAACDRVGLGARGVREHPRPTQRVQAPVPPRPVDEAHHRAFLLARRRVDVVRRRARRRRCEIGDPRRSAGDRDRSSGGRDHHGRRRCEQRGPHPGRKANVVGGCLQRQPSAQGARIAPNCALAGIFRGCAGACRRGRAPSPHTRSVFGVGQKSTATARDRAPGYHVAP